MPDEIEKIVERLEEEMVCNCDLDNWEPTKTTGHSRVCRIHKEAMRQRYSVFEMVERLRRIVRDAQRGNGKYTLDDYKYVVDELSKVLDFK